MREPMVTQTKDGSCAQTTTLVVPADAHYARVVRMTAANVATLASLTVEEVDDVRMAAEEAFVIACASGVEGTLDVSLTVDAPGQLEMTFSLGSLEADTGDDPSLEYAKLLLCALVDEAEALEAPARLHLVKKTGTADAL